MCHFNVRPRDTGEEEIEDEKAELEDAADPGFTEMEEAEDVRIVTDGGDE